MSAADDNQLSEASGDPFDPAGGSVPDGGAAEMTLGMEGSVLESLGASPEDRTDGLDGYAVKLSVFEGPLDLLLHLIRQNEVDITDIPIQQIAEQYLETIEVMQELNLDVAAEYLVMAATLALIKSRMLLPDEGAEDEEDSDPRADLVQRLLEYQRFKEAAETLSHRRLLGRDVWSVVGPGPEKTPDSEREIEVGLFDLVAAFKDVLDSAEGAALKHEIESEPVTIRDRMLVVMDLLEETETVEFMRIFETPGEDGPPTRAVLVATFLAVLELARLSVLRIYQGLSEAGTPEGAIRVRRAMIDSEDPEWRALIADAM